jgi:hypothetical protein
LFGVLFICCDSALVNRHPVIRSFMNINDYVSILFQRVFF